jgi:hypothetical protein
MNKQTRNITMTALFTALSVVFLYVAAVLPTGQLGFVAVSSLFAVAAVLESGLGAGLFVFVGSAVLGYLIVPNKTAVLLYGLFFGYYPVIKSLIERIRKRIPEWILKLVVFNAALTVIWFGLSAILFNSSILGASTYVIYLIGNVAFVLFDIGVTKLIGFYRKNISKKLRR